MDWLMHEMIILSEGWNIISYYIYIMIIEPGNVWTEVAWELC